MRASPYRPTNIYNEFGRDFYDVRRRFRRSGQSQFFFRISTPIASSLGLEYPLPGFRHRFIVFVRPQRGHEYQRGPIHPQQRRPCAGTRRGMRRHRRLRTARSAARRRYHYSGNAGLHPVYGHRHGPFQAEDSPMEPDRADRRDAGRASGRGRGRIFTLGGGCLYSGSDNEIRKYDWQQAGIDRRRLFGEGPLRGDLCAGQSGGCLWIGSDGSRPGIRLRHLWQRLYVRGRRPLRTSPRAHTPGNDIQRVSCTRHRRDVPRPERCLPGRKRSLQRGRRSGQSPDVDGRTNEKLRGRGRAGRFFRTHGRS